MSRISADLATETARTWHGLELRPDEAEATAKALEPMCGTAGAHVANLSFESEPADYERLLNDAK